MNDALHRNGDRSAPATSSRKPRLRGVLHQFSFFAAVAAGALLWLACPPGPASWGAGAFSASLAALLGVSAVYHRGDWPSRPRAWFRRLDHAAIFVFLAGTATPLCLALERGRGRALAVAWGLAALGVLKAMLFPFSAKWVNSALCATMGWSALVLAPTVLAVAGPRVLAVMLLGGAIYSVGALIYALKRPSPLPGVFGYLEVFHSLVVLGAACHFGGLAVLIQRLGPG
jgi:hemolysin III